MSSFGGRSSGRSPPRSLKGPSGGSPQHRRSSSRGAAAPRRNLSAELLAPETSKPRTVRIKVRVHGVRGVAGQVSPHVIVQLGSAVEHVKDFDHAVTLEAEDADAAARGIAVRVTNKTRGKDVIVGSASITRLNRGMTTEWLPLLAQGQKKGEVCVSIRPLDDLPSEAPSTDSEDGSVGPDPKSDDEEASVLAATATATTTTTMPAAQLQQPEKQATTQAAPPPPPPPPPPRKQAPVAPPPPPPRRHSDVGPSTQPLLPTPPPLPPAPPAPPARPLGKVSRSGTAPRWEMPQLAKLAGYWRIALLVAVAAIAMVGWRAFWRSEDRVDKLAASLLTRFGASKMIGPEVHFTIHDAADGLCFVGKEFRPCSDDAAWRLELTPHHELALVRLGSRRGEVGCLRSKPNALFGSLSVDRCGLDGTTGWYFNAGMLANDGHCLYRTSGGKAYMKKCTAPRQTPVSLLVAVGVPAISPRPILLDKIEPLLR